VVSCPANLARAACRVLPRDEYSDMITSMIIIIIIITDLYSAFRSEDTEVLDAAQED